MKTATKDAAGPAAQNGHATPEKSNELDPGAISGRRYSSPGQLTEKAARLVQAGLPWPGEEELEHGTRKMVIQHGVPWHIDKVRDSFDSKAIIMISSVLRLSCTRSRRPTVTVANSDELSTALLPRQGHPQQRSRDGRAPLSATEACLISLTTFKVACGTAASSHTRH